MQRTAMSFLDNWLTNTHRKPLVMRGARQTGKTWLVRHLAEQHKKTLIELNFEKRPQLASFFITNEPRDILFRLSSLTEGKSIDPQKSLLFFDEIQSYPEILAKLRWFAEDMPELPVIAAGSLLEFALAEITFSMPVGRISYMYLEPLSFEEFLLATNRGGLVNYLKAYQWGTEIPLIIHQDCMALFKEYIIVGGMPAAVARWIENHSLQETHSVHNDLMTSFRDDFTRYRGRVDIANLDEVMLNVPKHLGEKFVYSKVNPLIKAATIKQALDLLCKARVCGKVKGTAANGVPLGAEIQEKFLKVIFLDVGLCFTALKLSLDQLLSAQEIDLINSGGIAEQVVGQLLRTIEPFYIEPALYYWHREEGASAEIDYVIQHHGNVIPIEVKAGKTGKLKSLHVFMGLKKLPLAVRINSDLPSLTPVNLKDTQGKPIQYKLISLPFYLLGEVHRLLDLVEQN